MRRLLEPKIIFLVLLLVKILISAIVPLAHDEAYYWVWSHNLQLSYFDHPPFVSWLAFVSDFFDFGWGLIRLPAITLGVATLCLWYKMLKNFLSQDEIMFWLLLACASPLIGFGNSSLTPDVPLLFFWTLALFYLQKTLLSKKTLDAFLLGLCLGLGFLAKYHIVLFLPILLFYLILEKKWRDVSVKNFSVAVVTGLFVSLPVLLWNSQNDWISFLFQIDHGLGGEKWKVDWTAGYLLGQFLLVFPLVLYFAVKTTFKINTPEPLRIHHYFGWGPLLFFFFTSFRGIVEMNWPVLGYPSLFVLAALAIPNLKWASIKMATWAILIVTTCILFFNGSAHLPGKILESKKYQGLAKEVGDLSPVYASSYQMASQLWYEGKRPIYKLNGMSRFDFYDMRPESIPQSHFYVIRHSSQQLPKWVNERGLKWRCVRKLKDDIEIIEVNQWSDFSSSSC
ncbi:MAG: ArnT family glycosyltransferase [Pseudobdellovibrionaceae bacterium]